MNLTQNEMVESLGFFPMWLKLASCTSCCQDKVTCLIWSYAYVMYFQVQTNNMDALVFTNSLRLAGVLHAKLIKAEQLIKCFDLPGGAGG